MTVDVFHWLICRVVCACTGEKQEAVGGQADADPQSPKPQQPAEAQQQQQVAAADGLADAAGKPADALPPQARDAAPVASETFGAMQESATAAEHTVAAAAEALQGTQASVAIAADIPTVPQLEADSKQEEQKQEGEQGAQPSVAPPGGISGTQDEAETMTSGERELSFALSAPAPAEATQQAGGPDMSGDFALQPTTTQPTTMQPDTPKQPGTATEPDMARGPGQQGGDCAGADTAQCATPAPANSTAYAAQGATPAPADSIADAERELSFGLSTSLRQAAAHSVEEATAGSQPPSPPPDPSAASAFANSAAAAPEVEEKPKLDDQVSAESAASPFAMEAYSAAPS